MSAHAPLSANRYAFGSFRLDLERRRILQEGRSVSWRSERHFDLIKALIDSEPDVVPYQVLRERVWHGKEIEPHTIAQTVKNLRNRLGTSQDCIRNQPGKGYYFDRPPSEMIPKSHLDLEMASLLDVASAEWNRRTGASILRALTLFRRSVKVDPQCVRGHLGVAACITMGCQAGFGVLQKIELTEARKAADDAFSLATDNGMRAAAKSQIAQIRLMYDWDFKTAESLLIEAGALDSTHAPLYHFLGHLYVITNRWPEVMDAITTARRLAPSSPMLHSTAGLLLHFMRRHEEAINVCESCVSLHPDFGRGHVMLGLAYEADGQYEFAIKCFELASQLEDHATPIAALGHAHALAGNRAKARRAFEQLKKFAATQMVSQYFNALIHAGLGNTEEALTCLEQAHTERCDWLVHAGVDPRWDCLRSHERFGRLVRKIGLPDQ